MLDPIVKSIDVPCDQETAFEVFVTDMGQWWPLDKRSMSMVHHRQPPKGLQVNPQAGGKIVEIGHDGTAYHWGTFTTFQPFDFVAMDFHMGLPPENASLVEVRFESLDPENTRVTLVQSNWEAFGDMAEMMYRGYGSGWVLIFEQGYASACARR